MPILVEFEPDAEIGDISFEGTLSAEKLEQMAAKVWTDAGNGPIDFKCAKRLYMMKPEREIVCPSTGQDKLSAVVTTDGDKVSVSVGASP